MDGWMDAGTAWGEKQRSDMKQMAFPLRNNRKPIGFPQGWGYTSINAQMQSNLIHFQAVSFSSVLYYATMS